MPLIPEPLQHRLIQLRRVLHEYPELSGQEVNTAAVICKFLDGLDELLRDAERLIPLDRPPVILTGEYIPENFLLSRDSAGWGLSGLIDFGDVMTGWCEYDLLGPSGFMTAGVPRRVRSLFEGYGYSSADINPDLKRRLMALTLLHRFSDPARQICIEGWQQRASDLFELQDLLWPV
mgnify:CR=1 FL=1